jgi:hypothetical membrane protein
VQGVAQLAFALSPHAGVAVAAAAGAAQQGFAASTFSVLAFFAGAFCAVTLVVEKAKTRATAEIIIAILFMYFVLGFMKQR